MKEKFRPVIITLFTARVMDYKGKEFTKMEPDELEKCIDEIIFGVQQLPIGPSGIFVTNDRISFDFLLDEEVIVDTEDDMNLFEKNINAYLAQIPFGRFTGYPGGYEEEPDYEKNKTMILRGVLGIRNRIVPSDIKMNEIPHLNTQVQIIDHL